MKSIVLFSSTYCPDCTAIKEELAKNKVRYADVDITSGMGPLKRFLKLRDTRPEFDEIKAKGNVGIPCLVVNHGERICFAMPENPEELQEE